MYVTIYLCNSLAQKEQRCRKRKIHDIDQFMKGIPTPLYRKQSNSPVEETPRKIINGFQVILNPFVAEE